MNDQEKQIKLAEFVGWKCVEHCGTKRWIAPGSLGFTGYLDGPNFDPLTDANDCDALRKHLNGLGWSVVIDWQHDDPKHAPGVWIEFYHFETEIHERTERDRDDWMHGVCELALKVVL